MDLIIKEVSVFSEDAQMLISELNEILIGIVGNDGTKHVTLNDFEHDNSVFLVGYLDGCPICCAGIKYFEKDVAEIKRVYVKRGNKGASNILFGKIESWAKAHNYNRLILECREINQHAIDFYKKIGFKACEKFPPYENQADAICMDKILNH